MIIIDNNRPVIIGIVAGEDSGDILGYELIRSLKKYLKKVSFFGVGGTRMRSENMNCWYDTAELSVMGIVELISSLPSLWKIHKQLLNKFLMLRPDIFIGIDFPDFNISLEKRLKNNGIRTIHYVSPSVWAWRANRIFNIKNAADHILVLFPFERVIYEKFNIPCKLVGHVLADKIPLKPNKELMRHKLHIPQDKKCLALLPGSRVKEVKMLAYDFLKSAQLLNNNISNLEILIPFHNQKLIDYFIKLTESVSIKFRIFNTQKSWEILIASDVALLTAGTATLECMLAKCPMVVAYRMHFLTFMLIKKLVNTPWISLPNLLSNNNLVPEFIQSDCNPERLTTALINLLNYDDYQLQELKSKFYELHQSIKLNSGAQITRIVLRFLQFKN